MLTSQAHGLLFPSFPFLDITFFDRGVAIESVVDGAVESGVGERRRLRDEGGVSCDWTLSSSGLAALPGGLVVNFKVLLCALVDAGASPLLPEDCETMQDCCPTWPF